MLTTLLKTMIKDTEEQSDEEIHRVRCGDSHMQELLSPWNWGVLFSRCGCVHQDGNSANHLLLLGLYRGFLRKA